MVDWASIRKQVGGAIKSLGGDATLRRITEGAAPDPTKPWIKAAHDPDDDLAVSTKLVWDEVGVKDQDEAESLRFAYLPVGTVDPIRGDLIEESGGDTWQIVKDPIRTSPGGVNLMWSVSLRKWPSARASQ